MIDCPICIMAYILFPPTLSQSLFIYILLISQTKNDNIAELRKTFTLNLLSATGGATVLSTETRITVVANDYPHGMFAFQRPIKMLVAEFPTMVYHLFMNFEL